MKNLLPLFILPIMLATACKKDTTGAVATKTVVPDSVIVPHAMGFTPHIDTFTGHYKTKIGDGGFTDSTSKSGEIYINYLTDSNIILSGNWAYANTFDDIMGTAVFKTTDFVWGIVLGASGTSYSNPSQHVYYSTYLRSDSLDFNKRSSPGSCLVMQVQSFSGHKKH